MGVGVGVLAVTVGVGVTEPVGMTCVGMAVGGAVEVSEPWARSIGTVRRQKIATRALLAILTFTFYSLLSVDRAPWLAVVLV